MEMHQVRYFLAVARTLNFTRAAEEPAALPGRSDLHEDAARRELAQADRLGTMPASSMSRLSNNFRSTAQPSRLPVERDHAPY